jgi:hypothetical protein
MILEIYRLFDPEGPETLEPRVNLESVQGKRLAGGAIPAGASWGDDGDHCGAGGLGAHGRMDRVPFSPVNCGRKTPAASLRDFDRSGFGYAASWSWGRFNFTVS